jgi:hypothetical protein
MLLLSRDMVSTWLAKAAGKENVKNGRLRQTDSNAFNRLLRMNGTLPSPLAAQGL